jgi:hypothetical protein
MTGSLSLREHPADLVRLSCPKYGRAGQYRKQNLIERFGATGKGRRTVANIGRVTVPIF